MADIQSAYEFIKKNATAAGDNKFSLTRAHYLEYLKSQGLPRDVVDKYNAVHSDLINGADKFNSEHLIDLMKEKAGGEGKKVDPDDAKDLQVLTSINTPTGTLKLSNNGLRLSTVTASFGNSSGERKTIAKCNTFNINWKFKQSIDKDQRASLEQQVRDIIDLDADL